ncbi:MAG TPA: ABC transporter permease [Thermoanaerobaculia bacterium]|nr:ABC transporter permease [Thermoanaerobaculia bacterium]
MTSLLHDLRFTLRTFRRAPGFTAVAVLVLALGIGGNTAIFSLVDRLLLRALPYESPDRLVLVWENQAELGEARNLVSAVEYFAWSEEGQAFARLGAYTEAFFNLTGVDRPERLAGAIASPSLLPTLGLQPAQGRFFLPEEGEEGAPNVALLSHALWQRRFASDPGVVGRPLDLNGQVYTVVGILPPEFLLPGKQIEVLVPFVPDAEERANPDAHYLTVLGRLRPGIPLDQAQREMEQVARGLSQRYPDSAAGHGINLQPLHDELVGEVRPALLVLLAAVGFVLLIACTNLANLQLARITGRNGELAVRMALGASRRRVIRQLLTESLVLGLLGGVAGLLLASLLARALVVLSPAELPQLGAVGLDGRMLAFTLAVSLLTGMAVGLLPAFQVGRVDLQSALKVSGRRPAGSGGSRASVRRLLVAAEVAFSLILLIGAGLMIRSFANLLDVDPGFRTAGLVTLDLSIPAARLQEGDSVGAFLQRLIVRLENTPGIEAAGATTHLPLSGEDGDRSFSIEGRTPADPGEALGSEYRRVSPRYLEVLEVPLIRGRAFTERDTAETPLIVVVNRAFARRFFPNEDPIGKRLLIRDGETRPREIVGIMGNLRHFALEAAPEPEMYIPVLQRPWSNMTLVVAGSGTPAEIAETVRREVWSMDSQIPVSNVGTVEAYVERSMVRQRFTMLLLTVFGGIALVLASVGVYAVQSYLVQSRRQEIGIRMALGALPRDITGLVVGQGMLSIVVGLGLGIAAAFSLTRLLASLLFDVSALDLVTFVAVPVLLGLVALVACYLPARRAARLDPLALFAE